MEELPAAEPRKGEVTLSSLQKRDDKSRLMRMLLTSQPDHMGTDVTLCQHNATVYSLFTWASRSFART